MNNFVFNVPFGRSKEIKPLLPSSNQACQAAKANPTIGFEASQILFSL
jgi:hypothetical protein